MYISLTTELETAVTAKVDSGLYNKVSEVIREALRKSLLQNQENQWLSREAAIGYAQLQAEQTIEVISEPHFINLICRTT